MKMKNVLIVLAMIFAANSAWASSEEQMINSLFAMPAAEHQPLLLARSPGGCSTEQCCHNQMQQCYDNGGNEECSDRYEACVRNLR